MAWKVVIPGRLEGLNEFIAANRTNARAGNRMKRNSQRICYYYIRHCLKNVKFYGPVKLHYTFYEKDRKRDLDNISGYAHKVFQDALVEAGYLKNDGWSGIAGFSDSFYVDPDCPRIEVLIKGVRKRK